MSTNWLIAAVALLGLVLAWISGRQGAQSMLERESLLAELAPQIIATPEFVQSLERSNALDEKLDGRLQDLLSDESTAQSLLTQEAAQTQLSTSINRSLVEGYGRELIRSEVTKAVAKAAPAADNAEATPSNAAEVTRLRSIMRGYEGRLAQLATQVQDDESATIVNGLQGQLFEMQNLLTGLSQEVRCVVANGGGNTRNFLLKERRSTPLSGVNLLVSLGRLRKGVLNTVSISSHDPSANAGEVASTTAVKANVSIGNPFNFNANGRAYEGTFTYSQGRWGPDFVGFEMRDLGVTGAVNPDC